MQLHHKAVFTTLTYSNEHLPPTLDRKHLGGFVKRLRDRLARSEPGRTIRFFGCGEYGTRTKRPHYHALLSEWQSMKERLYKLHGISDTVTEKSHRSGSPTVQVTLQKIRR